MYIDLEIFFRVWIGGGGLRFNFINFFQVYQMMERLFKFRFSNYESVQYNNIFISGVYLFDMQNNKL